MCAQVQQMAGIATHTAARAARFDKGCNKEHGHWLPCPKGCFAKAAFTVLQMLAGQVARFCSVFRVPCSVLCALQLPPLQSKAHDAKTLSRLSGVYSLHKIACFFATPIYPADPGQTRCMLLFPAYLPALAPNQHGSASMNHPHTTHSAQTVRNAHGCFLRVYGRLLPAGRTCPVRSP